MPRRTAENVDTNALRPRVESRLLPNKGRHYTFLNVKKIFRGAITLHFVDWRLPVSLHMVMSR